MRMYLTNYMQIAKQEAEDFMLYNSSYMKPNNSYNKSPLTKKQKKNRNKSKLARKARKK